MSDTTEPTSFAAPALAAVATSPAVVLAFTADGARPPARRLLPPDGLVLGRDLVVFDGGPIRDTRMSRRHAEARAVPGEGLLRLRDLGSKNGMLVRGERVREATLGPGDAFRLGDTVFVVSLGGPVESDPELVGESPAMVGVVRSLRLVAPHAHTVLVQGETGTGKEVAARAIHRASGRAGRFVVVNCAALSEGLLESELFGHERGAFTGAHEAREGLFRAAGGGTLMLDEVGEMPLSLQAKLLRAADTGRVRPVGCAHEVDVDVRLVAATNADLAARVQAGSFRADLCARLAQWSIAMPSLRDRREDVPLLARHLLAALGAGERAIAVDLGEALLEQSWPLNVRGLRNVLAAALVASAKGGPLTLTAEARATLSMQASLMAEERSPERALEPRRPGMPDAQTLTAALAAARGSVAEAARALGSSRQQVYRWGKVLGVDVTEGRRR